MKYKELRMLYFSTIFFIVVVISISYFLSTGETTRGIIGSIIGLMILSMLITKYNLKVDTDYLVIYTFKGIGILPSLVDFKDIKDFKLLSKHKILITHNQKDTVYIVNAEAFYQELQEKYNIYMNSGKETQV